MDQNNGLEARIPKGGTRTSLMMDFGEVPLLFTRIAIQDQTLHMGITIRKLEDHIISAKSSHSKETMKIDLQMDPSTIRMEAGETMENFLVLLQPKGETSHKIFPIVNQEVTNQKILRSADLTIDLRLTLRLTNKSFHKTIFKQQLRWFASPQPTILLTKYQIFAR